MKLVCPTCQSRGKFIICAEVNVTVLGQNCFPQISTSNVSDFTYGDTSACTCATCGHHAHMSDFLDLSFSVLNIEEYGLDFYETKHAVLCPVYPLRPP